MGKFIIQLSPTCLKQLKKYKRYDGKLYKKILVVLQYFSDDPFRNSLHSHKVLLSNGREVFSSRVNGDIRVIWSYTDLTEVIRFLAIGGHSGKNKVYK